MFDITLSSQRESYYKRLAVWFLGFWITTLSINMVGDISHLSLLRLSGYYSEVTWMR